jgi:hypothetical protein
MSYTNSAYVDWKTSLSRFNIAGPKPGKRRRVVLGPANQRKKPAKSYGDETTKKIVGA